MAHVRLVHAFCALMTAGSVMLRRRKGSSCDIKSTDAVTDARNVGSARSLADLTPSPLGMWTVATFHTQKQNEYSDFA